MAEDLLIMLERIHNTLVEIQGLRKGMPELMDDPSTALLELERVRGTMPKIRGLWEVATHD